MTFKNIISAFVGFILLFLLYHGAEYMIVFRQSAIGFLTFHALFILAAYAIGRHQFGSGLKAWGFIVTRRTMLQMGLGLLIGISLYGLTFMVATASGIEQVMEIPPASQIWSMMGLFVFGNFFSSFSEDVLTRAYVYKHANGALKPLPLVLLSAIIYVLNHIYRLGDGPGTYIYLFLLGVLYMLPFIKTRQIWLTGAMHWGGNCTFYLTHEVFDTRQQPGFLAPNMLLSVFILFWVTMMAYFLFHKNASLSSNNPSHTA